MKQRLHGTPPSIVYGSGTTPVTLTDGTGDRSLSVTVDGYGSFGSSTPAGDAVFDPIGPVGPAGTVYESALYITTISRFLTTDVFGNLPPVAITLTSSTTATSQFQAGGLQIALTQTVTRTPNGSALVQSYRMQNVTSGPLAFGTVRFLDGDLTFDGSIQDFGGVSPDGRTLYEFDAGDDPSAASTFVGITDAGGTPAGFAIHSYPYTDVLQEFGGIPSSDLNVVASDTNGDGVTDVGYDVTLSLATSFTLEPGAATTYQTITRFGDQTLTPRATLSWDVPDQSAGELPPPQHLRALPVGAREEVAALLAGPRAEVTGYNVYSSTTSPVVPSPSTFFTSVPPGQTTANVPTSSGGSFFVVTATYAAGESGPSNEASADVPAATLTSVTVKSVKIVGKGSGFSTTVTVALDGIPFAAPPKVKGTTKVIQKGTLVTGETIAGYLARHGNVALVTFRNSNGGIASFRYPQ